MARNADILVRTRALADRNVRLTPHADFYTACEIAPERCLLRSRASKTKASPPRSQAHAPLEKAASSKEPLTQWLSAKGLALDERKTRIVQSRESGFVFLGFAFRRQQSRHGKYVHTCPSPAAEQALRDRIRGVTHRETTWKATAELVGEINQVSRGWAQYFAASHYARSFRQLNQLHHRTAAALAAH